jgi:hypothetical protein
MVTMMTLGAISTSFFLSEGVVSLLVDRSVGGAMHVVMFHDGSVGGSMMLFAPFTQLTG